MRHLLLLVALVACDKGKKAEPPVQDRWPQVVAAAKDLVPEGPSQDLTDAIALVQGEDVPEAAIDKLIAWSNAKGGLPWRGKHEIGGPAGTAELTAFHIGEEALKRRAGSRDAVIATIYLAQRMRGEGPCLFEAMLGFDLDSKTIDERLLLNLATEPTPTDAELHRALAVEAICARAAIDSSWKELAVDKRAARGGTIGDRGAYAGVNWDRSDVDERARAIAAFTEMALDAPADREQVPAFVEATRVKYGDSWLVRMLFITGARIQPMLAAMNAVPKPAPYPEP